MIPAVRLNLDDMKKPPSNAEPVRSAAEAREPVGVVRPRDTRAPPQSSDSVTPRLVKSRKGSILEIFGSQKTIDVEEHSKPKKGWLSVFIGDQWVKKFFMTLDGFMLYFNSEEFDITKPEGILHLSECDVVDCGTAKRFGFSINCQDGHGLTLMGEAPSDVWEWMSAIYLASKVSSKACLVAELTRESVEEHSRRLQLLSQQLVRTMDVELKSLHSQVRTLKQDVIKSLENLSTETEEKISKLRKTVADLNSKPSVNAVTSPFITQVVGIALKSLESQVSLFGEEIGTLKNSTRQELRKIKEEYEAQVFEMATRVASLRGSNGTQRGGMMSARDSGDGSESKGNLTNLSRAVLELRELATMLQPILSGSAAKDLDSTLSGAVRTKLVPVIADLPTISNLVKQLEDERLEQSKLRNKFENDLNILKERLEVAELDKSALSAEGKQAYEMLTHIEEQLYTEQTRNGEVFDFQDPTHVKVYKIMIAFARAMQLVGEVEEQLLALTSRQQTDRHEDE